jgi:ubiquinone biosynthesis protein Coq4
MKKYNEEYFSVIETKTGRKIADCGDEQDALMMISFDPQNRTISKNKMLMSQVVDIEIQKSLPTNNIEKVYSNNTVTKSTKELKQHYIPLPEGEGNPVIV